MCSIRNRSLLPTLFIVTGVCLAMSVCAQANSTTIPWMTGDFPGENTFGLFPAIYSPDGQWAFDIWTTVDEQVNGYWDCVPELGYCTWYGHGAITGGTAGGDLFHWDGSSFVPYATFNGWVTGGDVDKIEVYIGGVFTQYSYQYHYGFVGAWTNQWHTSGNVYGWNLWYGYGEPGPGGSWFSLTTSTPEPGTIALFVTGALGLARAIYKKILI